MALLPILLVLCGLASLSRADAAEPTCNGGEIASTEQELNLKELLYVNEAIELYKQKIANIERHIEFKKEQQVNQTGMHDAMVTKGSYNYFINLLKGEVVDSAYNTLFTEMTDQLRDQKKEQVEDPSQKKQGQPPLPFEFLPESTFKKAEHHLSMQPDLLYNLLEIDEQETVVMHKFVAIRPVAVVGTSMGTVGRVAPLDGSGDQSAPRRGFNKGHIINAGILYILESGQLKIVTSTGTVLVEKSTTFDVNPQSFEGQL